jgi:polar amino acid transport system substrate-binding protein
VSITFQRILATGMARVTWQTRWLMTLAAIVLCGVVASMQSPAATLAPTGTLRAVFLGGNPVQGRVDTKTGDTSGTVPDLTRELARRLGIPVAIASAPDAGGVIAALRNGTADIGFLAYDEMRAREVDFGPAFVVMANSYLVKASSPIRASKDVDRAGVTVAAVKGQTQQHFVSSAMKQARVRVLDVMPPQADVDMLLTNGTVDAFAINRQRALEAEAASDGRLRALPDSFLDVDQCVVVAKGNAARLESIERLVAELRASGFIKQSIDRAKLVGVDVAPARKR